MNSIFELLTEIEYQLKLFGIKDHNEFDILYKIVEQIGWKFEFYLNEKDFTKEEIQNYILLKDEKLYNINFIYINNFLSTKVKEDVINKVINNSLEIFC
jgi:hypothetical protein